MPQGLSAHGTHPHVLDDVGWQQNTDCDTWAGSLENLCGSPTAMPAKQHCCFYFTIANQDATPSGMPETEKFCQHECYNIQSHIEQVSRAC